MQIEIRNGGKRFNREWIFRGLSHTFVAGRPTVVLGSNGSGKSTLLQALSTRTMLSEGEVVFLGPGAENHVLPQEQCYKTIALAAPYLELIEEFTLKEMIAFFLEHKRFQEGIGIDEAIGLMQLQRSAGKALRYFSSGMKQRVKLALAIASDTPVLLLDEPTSNLDHKAIEWYRQLIDRFTSGRVVIVCSNHQEAEYSFCADQLVIEHYKPSTVRG